MPFLPPTNSVKAPKVHKVTAKEPEKQDFLVFKKND